MLSNSPPTGLNRVWGASKVPGGAFDMLVTFVSRTFSIKAVAYHLHPSPMLLAFSAVAKFAGIWKPCQLGGRKMARIQTSAQLLACNDDW